MEGINNKARVITKRTYGLKSAESLWTRLILDPESGHGGDRLVDRADPPDGPRAESPFRPVLHLKTEEPFCFRRRYGNVGLVWISATMLLAHDDNTL